MLTWGDYTRTRLALHDTRSALWAGLCTFFLILRHPVKTLRPFVLLLVVEWKTIGLLFVLGQLAMIVQTIVRAARYKAAVLVSRRLVQPLAQRDPWEKRVGGPGGPQYPIDETDEYGISY